MRFLDAKSKNYSKHLVWVFLTCWLLITIGCSSDSTKNGPAIGVLIDYTGVAAADGFNHERGILLAAKLMDEAQDGDHSFHFIFRDSQADPKIARRETLELINEGVVAVIGPSNDELVEAVAQPLFEADILLFSALATIGDHATIEKPWCRMSPGNIFGSTTPALIGENMANLLVDREQLHVLIVSDNNIYDFELVKGFKDKLLEKGGEIVNEFSIQTVAAQDIANTQANNNIDGVLLATNILPAAELISEVMAVSSVVPNWFFTPRLKSEVLFLNTPSGALEGATGLSLYIPYLAQVCREDQPEKCFVKQFENAWGDKPFEETYFVYDTAAVLMIALEQALHTGDGNIDRATLTQNILNIGNASRDGIQVEWNDFSVALSAIKNGQNVLYSGLTGPIRFRNTGERLGGQTTVFTVKNNKFVEDIR
ncbi:MAG: amino acid ABC transporter substrate-binding protein [Deltaproteobacteria bacterium]|nr:amino acid ABC transporter substrate-binding protein [Deltaproteobacteria bacterium]